VELSKPETSLVLFLAQVGKKLVTYVLLLPFDRLHYRTAHFRFCLPVLKASTATDGSKCVWCSLKSFGFCVSEDQAEAMKKSLPDVQCDSGDDDAVPDDDDSTGNDDDVDTDDDAVPDNYWECLKNYGDSKACGEAGCSWCVSTR
jgi:hypothetical protein